jgi:hypothetical protein
MIASSVYHITRNSWLLLLTDIPFVAIGIFFFFDAIADAQLARQYKEYDREQEQARLARKASKSR